MLKRLCAIIILCIGMMLPSPAQAQTLILIVDISDSMSIEEKRFQMQSYAKVLDDMQWYDHYRIDVLAFATNLDYAVEQGTRQDAINYFLTWENRPSVHGSTCIHNPIVAVLERIQTYSHPIIIDISGDGVHNCTQSVGTDRHGMSMPDLSMKLDHLENHGAQINTLYFWNGERTDGMNMQDSYADMARGNGFSIFINTYLEFEIALYQKLSREVASLGK